MMAVQMIECQMFGCEWIANFERAQVLPAHVFNLTPASLPVTNLVIQCLDDSQF